MHSAHEYEIQRAREIRNIAKLYDISVAEACEVWVVLRTILSLGVFLTLLNKPEQTMEFLKRARDALEKHEGIKPNVP